MTWGRCKLRTDARVRDVYKIGRTLGSGGAPVSNSVLCAQRPCVLDASSLPVAGRADGCTLQRMRL